MIAVKLSPHSEQVTVILPLPSGTLHFAPQKVHLQEIDLFFVADFFREAVKVLRSGGTAFL